MRILSKRHWSPRTPRAPVASTANAPSGQARPFASANDAPGEGFGAKLNENSLRYARGYSCGARRGAPYGVPISMGAYLTEADLRNANLA